MTIYVCKDCGFEIRCRGCHNWCPRCAGEIVARDYAQYKLQKQDEYIKNGN